MQSIAEYCRVLKIPLETLLLDHLIYLDNISNDHGPQWHSWRCKCMWSDSVCELLERFEGRTENDMAARTVRYNA